MADTLAFDILARDKASASFRTAASSASDLAKKLDLTSLSSKAVADALKKQGKASDLTAAQSRALASVLRLTGSEEDKLAAKSLLADAAVKRLGDSMGTASKKASSAGGGLTLFGKAMLALNIATGIGEPALASLTVVVAGLSSALVAAGAGLGVFGAVAKTVYSEASTAATAYQAAQQKFNAATTSAQRVSALKAEKAAYAGLSPPVKAFAGQIISVRGEWKKFTDAAAPGVIGVISQGFGLLPKVFAAMQPFLAPTEKALHGLISQLGKGLSSAGFKSFIDSLAKASGPNITNLGQSIGHIAVGLGGVVKTFLPFATQMTHGLDNITARFAKWGTTLSGHSGFQSLISTFKADGPLVLSSLKSLGSLLKSVIGDMAGLNGIGNSRLLLQIASPFLALAAALAKSNPWLVKLILYTLAFKSGIGKVVPLVTGFTSAFGGAWKAVVKFAGAEVAAGTAVEGMTVAQTIAAAATRAWGIAMDALPWVALAAAVIAVAVVVIKYHRQIWAFVKRIWNDVWGWIKTTWDKIWAFAKQWWPLLLGVGGLIWKYHQQIWNFIQRIWTDVINWFKTTWDTIWTDAKRIWGAITSWVGGLPGRILKALGQAATVLLGWGKSVITGLWHGMTSVIGSVWTFIKGIPGKILHFLGIKSPPDWAIEAGRHIMNGLGIGMSQAKGALAAGAAGARAAVAGSGGSIAALMRKMAAARGWTGSQWQSLDNVEMREAGFQLNAQNKNSGAYGLAQFINGPSEYAQYGGNATTASGQIIAMLNYIAQRYGNPAGAWAHELQYGWYDRGGWLPTGVSLAVNNTGRPERVVGPGGSGSTYNINVAVAPGSEREAGRQIVSAIRAFEKGSGSGWRK